MEKLLLEHAWIIILVFLWTLPWKAVALWRSARRGHMGWFLTLLILNTLAILDIIYIFIFSGPEKEKKLQPENDQPILPTRDKYYGEQNKFSSSSKSRSAII